MQVYKSGHILQLNAPMQPNIIRNAIKILFSCNKKMNCLHFFEHKHRNICQSAPTTKPEKEVQNVIELLK